MSEAQNLYLTVLNDPRLSPFGSGKGREISLMLIRKKWARRYDSSKAAKAYQVLTDQAARENAKQFGSRSTVADRKQAAAELRDDFERRVQTGELDSIFPQSLMAHRSLGGGVMAIAELKPHGIAGSIQSANGPKLPVSIPAKVTTVKQALDTIARAFKKSGGGKKSPTRQPSKTAQRKATETRRRVLLRRLGDATTAEERLELATKAEAQHATKAEVHRALAKSQKSQAAADRKRSTTLRRNLHTLIADQKLHRDDYRVRQVADELKRFGATALIIDDLLAKAERARAARSKAAARTRPPAAKGAQPRSGYAYKGSSRVTGANWRKMRDDEWEIVMLTPDRAGKIDFLGARTIDGSRVNVWRIHDPMLGDFHYYAQQK